MFSWGDLWGEDCHFNLRFSGLLVDCRWKMTLASEIINVIVQATQLGKKYVFGKARCDYVEHLRHETRSAVYWSLGRSPLAGCALFARFVVGFLFGPACLSCKSFTTQGALKNPEAIIFVAWFWYGYLFPSCWGFRLQWSSPWLAVLSVKPTRCISLGFLVCGCFGVSGCFFSSPFQKCEGKGKWKMVVRKAFSVSGLFALFSLSTGSVKYLFKCLSA